MYYFIVNPLAGSKKGARYGQEIEHILSSKKIDHVLKLTEYAGHATILAKEFCAQEDCTTLIAVGGDGTFCEVLNGMDLKIPLGLMAAGTGNDFARSAGLNLECSPALNDILEGTPSFIDYIDINGWRSLNVSGTGFDVDLSLVAIRLKKHIKGAVSYYIALLYTLLNFPFRPAEIEIDGEKKFSTSIMLIAAANGKKYGGGLPIAPDAILNDGLMDVVIIRKLPRWKIPYLLIKFLGGKLLLITKYVDFYRCKSVSCSLKEPVLLNVDGELVSSTPFFAKVCTEELKLFMPFDKK